MAGKKPQPAGAGSSRQKFLAAAGDSFLWRLAGWKMAAHGSITGFVKGQ